MCWFTACSSMSAKPTRLDRHYYASHDYNSMLQGVAALPTKDGTLVILHLVRVSTDQVGGLDLRRNIPSLVPYRRALS